MKNKSAPFANHETRNGCHAAQVRTELYNGDFLFYIGTALVGIYDTANDRLYAYEEKVRRAIQSSANGALPSGGIKYSEEAL